MMPDSLPQVAYLVNNIDAFTILVSLAFMFIIFYIGIKKGKNPVFLGLVNFVFFLMAFISYSGTSSQYLMIVILAIAGLTTLIMNKSILGNAGEQKIFMSYLIFFATAFFFSNYVNLTSGLFSGGVDAVISPVCNPGTNPLTALINMAICGLTTIGSFFQFFSWSSTIGIVNTVLFVPFTYFIIKYIADWMRGRSG